MPNLPTAMELVVLFPRVAAVAPAVPIGIRRSYRRDEGGACTSEYQRALLAQVILCILLERENRLPRESERADDVRVDARPEILLGHSQEVLPNACSRIEEGHAHGVIRPFRFDGGKGGRKGFVRVRGHGEGERLRAGR
jgi:hypothetical protein